MNASDRFYPIKDDFRDPFSRDRDRIIHSGSFRRLEYKTQVFINTIGDFFRTRLTHSLEVSQIARSIARHLGFNETLAEAIALAHDLGHTPFGHIGGDELDRLLKEDGHTMGFEHNFQSFRMVTKLEKRYKEFNGLNLTFATLEGILKHSKPYKKPFLDDRFEIFKLDFYPSLEAIIVDKADEIAYISHDIEDGIKSRLIRYDDLAESELVNEVIKLVNKEGVTKEDEVFRYRFSSNMINHLVYSFLQYSKNHKFDTSKPLCGVIPAQEELKFGFDKATEKKLEELKQILFIKLYRHNQVGKKMFFGKRCINGLYKAFIKEPNLLPKELYKRIEEGEKTHRVVADYIASLSDRAAMKLYKELYIG